jgi:hypothetical protein
VAALVLSLYVPLASADSIHSGIHSHKFTNHEAIVDEVSAPPDIDLTIEQANDLIAQMELNIGYFEQYFPQVVPDLEHYILPTTIEQDWPFLFEPPFISESSDLDDHLTTVPEPNTAELMGIAGLGVTLYLLGKWLRG